MDPRVTLEIPGGTRRLDRIFPLIQGCRFSIHDLSRVQLDGKHPRTPRLNMPFELGLAVAWERGHKAERTWFVMESMNHLLAKALTDLNGTDPYIHGGVSGLGGRKTKKKGKVKDTAQKPEGRAIGKQKANAISLTCRVTREDIGFASSSSGWASKKDGFNGT